MAFNAYTPPSPYRDQSDDSPVEGSHDDFPPPPPAHRTPVGMHPESSYAQTQGQRSYNHDPNNYSNYSPPGVTPGTDNLGEGAAGGGINGIAMGVAGSHERESGVQAMRDIDGSSSGRSGRSQTSINQTPFADQYAYDGPIHPRPIHSPSQGPYAAAALAPIGMYSNNSSQQSMPLNSPSNAYPYSDSPYNRYSSSNLDLAPQMGDINPNDLADDDDWGMGPTQTGTAQQKRRSFVPFGHGSRDGTPPSSSAAAVGTGAAAGGVAAGVAAGASRDGSGSYNAVPNADVLEPAREKSAMLQRENSGRKKTMWIAVAVIAVVVIGAIVGGVAGTMVHRGGGNGDAKSSSGTSADAVKEDNKDDLSLKSDEIQKLMGNSDLHKVFPGMDYTPLNAQYPECLHVGPSQNNITRDIAVMSQLTNAVRLYGTDCNQTEMILHAIDRLELKDMKVWMGVWLGNNDTTNTRQVDQMWEIIDKHGGDKFKGIIVGNEVLYRKDLSETELLKYITDIRSNLTKHSIDLPVAISDLGDNWTKDMAEKVDVVMSNVHPFFAGVTAKAATSWTWTFWQTHDVVLTQNDPDIKQVIAEVGWPTAGGNNCGESDCASSTQGSVAGVDELNTFMESWICPSLKNGTEYFWQVYYNTAVSITSNTMQVLRLRRALEDRIQRGWQRVGRQVGPHGRRSKPEERRDHSRLRRQDGIITTLGPTRIFPFSTATIVLHAAWRKRRSISGMLQWTLSWFFLLDGAYTRMLGGPRAGSHLDTLRRFCSLPSPAGWLATYTAKDIYYWGVLVLWI